MFNRINIIILSLTLCSFSNQKIKIESYHLDDKNRIFRLLFQDSKGRNVLIDENSIRFGEVGDGIKILHGVDPSTKLISEFHTENTVVVLYKRSVLSLLALISKNKDGEWKVSYKDKIKVPIEGSMLSFDPYKIEPIINEGRIELLCDELGWISFNTERNRAFFNNKKTGKKISLEELNKPSEKSLKSEQSVVTSPFDHDDNVPKSFSASEKSLLYTNKNLLPEIESAEEDKTTSFLWLILGLVALLAIVFYMLKGKIKR